MHDGTLNISGKTRTASLAAALIVLLLLSLVAARTLVGAFLYASVPGILADRAMEGTAAIKDLSEDTVPAYQEAIRTLELAAGADRSRALVRRAMADISVRLGSWTETMEILRAALPEGMPGSKQAFDRASVHMREAVRLQPTNPDHHLAYGHLSRMSGDDDIARREYQRAADAYPVNASVRYAVSVGFLAAGMHAEALEQAKELARIDDSYKIPGSGISRQAIEQRAPVYIRRLSGSYLFKAFEIVWKASVKDINMVRSVVPDNEEARDVFELYLEVKGIEL